MSKIHSCVCAGGKAGIVYVAVMLVFLSQGTAAAFNAQPPFVKNGPFIKAPCSNDRNAQGVYICPNFAPGSTQPENPASNQKAIAWMAIKMAFDKCAGGMGPCTPESPSFDHHEDQMMVTFAYLDDREAGNRQWAFVAQVWLSCDGTPLYRKQVAGRTGGPIDTCGAGPCAPPIKEPYDIQIGDAC